jgi:aldose 1-epimerase
MESQVLSSPRILWYHAGLARFPQAIANRTQSDRPPLQNNLSNADAIFSEPFGKTADDTSVELYTLRNRHGMEARIATYGGIVTHLTAPDLLGSFGDIVLGYDTLDQYLAHSPYFGALIGRYGNRIANGRFTLDGTTYQLARNNGPNSLHGGIVGFDKVVWKVEGAEISDVGARLTLSYMSPDGEEGYPGNLSVTAVYTLTYDNSLRLDFTATTDAVTVLNLTHHSYFNLRGRGHILDHVVQIEAGTFTPVGPTLIPTGEIRSVDHSPFDFRQPVPMGERIDLDDEQLQFGNGYDHNWILTKPSGILVRAATVYESGTGRVMEVWTTAPGMQFYSGNFLDGTVTGKNGRVYERRSGFCMEPQHFPDSPNHPNFPSTRLAPGELYHNTIIYKFKAQ